MSQNWKTAPGERLYAVGDVHGRADLFLELMGLIREDSALRAPLTTRIVVLGDFIDRGPSAAELVGWLMRYSRASERFIVLKGNHEQGMTDALGGDFGTLRSWLAVGGEQTLQSWGVTRETLSGSSPSEIVKAARRCVRPDVLRWMELLPTSYRSGDILFVHAGVRPGVPLARQSSADLLWIGQEFLESEQPHPFLVVHGHTISEDGPELRPNRIGIDTGAYRTGRLTALGLERDQRWILST